MARARGGANGSFDVLKAPRHVFSPERVAREFQSVDRGRVEALADDLCRYITQNLPAAFEKRSGLSDYRTNPYVLTTAASAIKLNQADAFGAFLFNSKLYMALETSFGKSIETAFVRPYPFAADRKWEEAPEKVEESRHLVGLNREDKAKARVASVWREVDRSVVVGRCRYLTSIKSGPNTINDTQVQGMTQAIILHHREWLEKSRRNYGGVAEIDMTADGHHGEKAAEPIRGWRHIEPAR